MEINKTTIKVRDLFEGYKDSQQNGVIAYGGRLDVRPAYQREFVYKDKQRDAVIDTLTKGFPLNTMYWVKKEDGNYEVLDGQQRTISICQYLNSDFSIDALYFHNLQQDLREAILNYELDVYICEGGDTEKLEWFKTINIAGEKLSLQELRNAVYSGSWLSEAKKYFSYIGCPGVKVGDKYVVAEVIRQGLLEKALIWISMRDNCTIEDYMARHQHDLDAADLWKYYREVIEWIEGLFLYYRKEMKQVDWGTLFHKYGNNKYNPTDIKEEVDKLMADEDVSKKAGIYPYIFTREEKYLSIRSFDTSTKRQKYEEQQGNCPICGNHFKIDEMEADHIIPWSKGGHTTLDNCQMLCKKCNREKGNS